MANDTTKTVNDPGDAMPLHKQLAMGKPVKTGGSNKAAAGGPRTPA